MSSIYRGFHDEQHSANDEFNLFNKEYAEKIYFPSAASSVLMGIALESKAGVKTNFSDITFHLKDGQMTAHRVILHANPNTSSSLIPVDALYSTDLSLPMSVSTFSILKLWLYTGNISVLSDKIALLEWCAQYGEESPSVQYCIQNIVSSRNIPNIVQLVGIAHQYKLLKFLEWLEWYLACNYDSYRKDIKKLPVDVAGRVVKNEWPGEDHNEKVRVWKIQKEEAQKAKKGDQSNCNIQ